MICLGFELIGLQDGRNMLIHCAMTAAPIPSISSPVNQTYAFMMANKKLKIRFNVTWGDILKDFSFPGLCLVKYYTRCYRNARFDTIW